MANDIFDETIWKVQEDAKPGKILANLNPKSPKISWFRALNGDKNGHEFLAYKLGQLLNLPVAEIRLRDNVEGETGLEPGSISFLVVIGNNDWSFFPHKENFEEHFDIPKLIKAITFDIWISNSDRNHENFQYVKIPGEDKYSFFLIDHTECFSNKDNRDIGSLVRVEQFRKLFKSNKEEFYKAIEKIKSLDNNKISEAVDSVPENFLSSQRKIDIKSLLEFRLTILGDLIENFATL